MKILATFLLGSTLISFGAELSANGDSVTEADKCPPIKVVESPYLHQQWHGATNPEKIPMQYKIWVFEVRFEHLENELVRVLSSNDYALLANAKSESGYWRTLVNNRSSSELAELCSRIDTVDILEIATEFEQLASESNERGAEKMLLGIESLSPTGRESVLQVIEEEVTPTLSYPMTNLVGEAEDDPERFRGSLEVECYVSIYGDLPPEVKRASECAVQKLKPAPERGESDYTSLQPPSRN